MTNPFEPPRHVSSIEGGSTKAHRHPLVDYWIGFRNGALWSLIIAIPTTFAIYGEFTVGRGYKFDPVTKSTIRVDLTVYDVWYCMTAAVVWTAVLVTSPWAFVAGFVNWNRARERRGDVVDNG